MSSLFEEIKVYTKVYHHFRIHSNDKELEQLIGTSGVQSHLYSFYVIGGKFELGEEVIATNPWASYWYAVDVIGGRFKLGEKAISFHSGINKMYQDFLESL